MNQKTQTGSTGPMRCSAADGPQLTVNADGSADDTPKKPVEWRYQTTMDNGGRCVVKIDLVDGKCSTPVEAQELLDWFEIVTRRLRRQANAASGPG